MIKEIIIKNFQSHRSTKLELSDGVNCIIGQTDAGKSSIFRALQFAIGRSTGQAFLPLHSNKNKINASVELKFDDDQSIKRTKGKKVNKFQTSEGLEFEKFGIEPPSEILKVLDIEEWLNLHHQDDSPFLLSMTGGQAAEVLNKVIKIDAIDSIVKRANKNEKDIKWKIKETELEILNKEKELDNLEWIDIADHKLKHIEIRENELKENERRYQELSQCLEDLEQAGEALKRIRIIPLKIIEKLENKYKKLNEMEERQYNIIEVFKQLDDLEHDLKGIEADLINIELEFKDIAPKTCPTCGQEVKKWRI